MARRLTLFVYGESGHGKSWLLNSAPGPKLYLDAEGRAEYLADPRDPTGMTQQPQITWDPRNPIPAESSDPNVVTVVDVQQFTDVKLAYDWLASGKHPFVSLLVDSITEVQQRCMDAITGGQSRPAETQDWGTLLRDLESIIRKMRDLRKHATNPLWVVAVVAGAQEKNHKQRALLQGQLALKIAYHFDCVGYLVRGQDETTGADQRTLYIRPYGPYDAKDDTHVLSTHYGPFITNPSIGQMLAVLNPQPAAS